MLYKSLIIAMLLSVSAHAEVTAGVGFFSWQQKVPVILNSVRFDTNTTFTSLGPSLGYENLLTARVRYGITLSYHSGTADILKLDGAVSPRRNFVSYWGAAKTLWRVTKTFAFGPVFLYNQSQLTGLSASTSTGGFVNLEYDLFDDVRLIQSLGTVGDSGNLAYSFNIARSF